MTVVVNAHYIAKNVLRVLEKYSIIFFVLNDLLSIMNINLVCFLFYAFECFNFVIF